MDPTLLQDNFTRMIFRDAARDDLPPGAVWDSVNLLPDFGAPLRKRGGWSYWSVAPTGSGTGYIAGAYAPFSAGDQVIGITDTGEVIVLAAGSATNKGGTMTTVDKPKWFKNLLIITPDSGGAAVKKYDGSAAPANLGGTPPEAMFAAVWKAYLVLASAPKSIFGQKNRAWFSGINNPESWNTADPGGAWVDFSQPITGLAPLKSALLFFAEGQTERLRGDNPPPGGDMQKEFAFPVGCTDARSIAYYEDSVIFANPQGVYQSDGASVSNLTRACGASQYWQTLLAGYVSPLQDPSLHTVLAGEVYRDYYILNVVNSSGTTLASLAFNLDRKTWFRLSGIDGSAFIRTSAGTTEELFLLQDVASKRVPRLSAMWSFANPQDGSGAAISVLLETPFYQGGRAGLKRWHDLYAGYDIRAAGGSPGLLAEWVTTPEETTYLTPTGLFPETSKYTRNRVPLHKKAHGLGFKLTNSATADDVRIYSLEATVEALEGSRRI